MSRHCLAQIDLIARTAVCSVCGPTEIHVSRPGSGNPADVCCVQQIRDRRQAGWRPSHILIEIDEQTLTGVCAICGPTEVYRFKSKGYLIYRCATYMRVFARQVKGAHIVNPNARIHVLSVIDEEKNTAMCAKCGPVRIERNSRLFSAGVDPGAVPVSAAPRLKNTRAQKNTRVVYEYMRRQACKRCGSMAIVGPYGFGFFERHLPKQQRIAMLVLKAEPDELAAELEKRDLYCRKCLHLVNTSFANQTPVPEFRPFPTFF